MDSFLWWSGVALWLSLGLLGVMVLADWLMDIVVTLSPDRLRSRDGKTEAKAENPNDIWCQ